MVHRFNDELDVMNRFIVVLIFITLLHFFENTLLWSDRGL